MSATPKRNARPSKRTSNAAGAGGHHTCRTCPVCGMEECKILQELGMYCDTACAAFEATRARAERSEKGRTTAEAAQKAQGFGRDPAPGS